MKTFILENIYASKESVPSVCSTVMFSTLDEAVEAAQEAFEKGLKEYRQTYKSDAITTEEGYQNLYIKGPDFIDWWTVVEVPTTKEENK